jgi:hypothetical protein
MRPLLLILALAACSGKSNNKMAPADMAMMQQPNVDLASNPDLAPSCVMNPMTHLELINACTTADSVDKTPQYPVLAPNGQLPPLP